MTDENEITNLVAGLPQFIFDKTFNEDTPIQYTNKIVCDELTKEIQATDPGNVYDCRAFVGKAMQLYQTDYEKYKEYLGKAGFSYE